MQNTPARPIDRVPELVRCVYAIVSELETLFPGRKFTPDGHLVGSIGEVIAAHRYGVELESASTKGHDAKASDGREVEIKVTQGTRVALRAKAKHLLVLHLARDGSTSEIFNGPGAVAWAHCGTKQKNGQYSISIAKLQELMEKVHQSQRLPLHKDA
jgi:hypothetical protein